MKKVMMMAIALMVSSMTFAGDSDALKAIMKCKDYAQAAEMLKQTVGQLADNAEKAEAYNHLVDLAMEKVDVENEKAIKNRAVPGSGGEVDNIVFGDGICNAINAAIECNKYDQMPNAKGKVKPRFEKNCEKVWHARLQLVNIGNDFAGKNDTKNALKYWGTYTETYGLPYFEKMDKTNDKPYIGQVAYYSGLFARDAKEIEKATKYFEIAKLDTAFKAKAQNEQINAMRNSLKSHADSLAFVGKLKEMYAAEPENEVIVDAINGMYDGLDKKAQSDFLDQHLQKFPNSFSALANKGLLAINANNAEEGAKWLQKAAAVRPDNPIVYFYLGTCLNAQAANSEDKTKRNEYSLKAIEAFEKTKELDPDKRVINWGYNRYQAYYILYGADDPKTKAAEADK